MHSERSWPIFVLAMMMMTMRLSECSDDDQMPPDKFFLHEIFRKYGNDGEINYEGFEHLLDSLGLGGRVFETHHELSLHIVNGTFAQIHDSSHRHKRHSESNGIISSKVKNCLSPYEMLKIYGLENHNTSVVIKEDTFLHICPALVYQLDQKLCIVAAPVLPDADEYKMAWLYTGLCVLIISASGLLGAAIMPIINSIFFDNVLHFLVAVAVGTLCGDALLHLLPHAMESHGHGHGHDHRDPVFKCTVTLAAILVFYLLESTMRTCVGHHHHHHHHHDHHQHHDGEELDDMIAKKETKKPLTPVALMVVLGDTLHNLTDGLAIGAAFSTDIIAGFATALAVFCHELPHELGDFAVLLRSGVSIRKAIYCNVFSSVLSFIGAALGLWLGEDHESSSGWIYAATAGTFLYIALVDLIPEMNNASKGPFATMIAFVGIVSGYVLMFSIAMYEDSLIELLDYR